MEDWKIRAAASLGSRHRDILLEEEAREAAKGVATLDRLLFEQLCMACEAACDAQPDRKVKLSRNTFLFHEGQQFPSYVVQFHASRIATIRLRSLQINADGWRSGTTQARINELLGGFLIPGSPNLPFMLVTNAEGAWGIRERESRLTYPFYDGITIRQGSQSVFDIELETKPAEPAVQRDRNARLVAQIEEYAVLYMKALSEGHVPNGRTDAAAVELQALRTADGLRYDTTKLKAMLDALDFLPGVLAEAIRMKSLNPVLTMNLGFVWSNARLWGPGAGTELKTLNDDGVMQLLRTEGAKSITTWLRFQFGFGVDTGAVIS